VERRVLPEAGLAGEQQRPVPRAGLFKGRNRCGGGIGPAPLNRVERWFGLITDKTIRRGTFYSVEELERAIYA
jgi:hypothetical protein